MWKEAKGKKFEHTVSTVCPDSPNQSPDSESVACQIPPEELFVVVLKQHRKKSERKKYRTASACQALPGDSAPSFPVMSKLSAVSANPAHTPFDLGIVYPRLRLNSTGELDGVAFGGIRVILPLVLHL